MASPASALPAIAEHAPQPRAILQVAQQLYAALARLFTPIPGHDDSGYWEAVGRGM